ncbi:MAG TPA: DUF5715 family protein [Gammaproteobacteria bacterium]|nr:DUF5715 family protein [Gammaproteobacteria bacterium]
MDRAVTIAIAGIVIGATAPAAEAQSLRGSTQAMQRQHTVAQQHDYSFLRTSSQVHRFVSSGLLEPLRGNANYELAGVSHPYARPAVRLFVERLSAQYRAACGEKLVVTSLTRPVLNQPRNASDLSVHPAGMAVDLRVSSRSACRRWLEQTLLSLEQRGVLDATRENRPPHYHVALFPNRYSSYVAQLTRATTPVVARATPPTAPAQTPVRVVSNGSQVDERQTYRINRGDSLWSIARRHGTTVELLQEMNNLRTTQITAGQMITVPATANGAEQSPDS